MLFRQIELFCEVARTGSFTRAAETFDVSQSAVSQQVKSLERYLGVELLARMCLVKVSPTKSAS